MQLETVGEIVRVLRARRGLEQVELARACGWRDASAVSRIETDRIRPTRRTLNKLADNLAEPDVTGPGSQIRSWLYLAAGILPSKEEAAAMAARFPDIASWTQPAMILDFGWYLWRANELSQRLVGLPQAFQGRNYLELLFDPHGPMRPHMGERWEAVAKFTIEQFRAQNRRKVEQRWFRKLTASLDDLPDFRRIWRATEEAPQGLVSHRQEARTPRGTIAMLTLKLTDDPRFWVAHIVPEDLEATRHFSEGGALLR